MRHSDYTGILIGCPNQEEFEMGRQPDMLWFGMSQSPPIRDFLRFGVTSGTIALAVATSLAWWSNCDISPLMEGPGIRQFQLWRLITSALPHGDLLHLTFNAYWLWVFGTRVEGVFGHLRTALLYVGLATVSGAAEFAFLEGGVGLSGVGYGLFGLLWVLAISDERFSGAITQRTVSLFITWFFLCIVLTVQKVMPVGNIAHGVGWLVGLLIGWAIVRPSIRPVVYSIMLPIIAGLIGLATVGRSYVNFSNNGYCEATLSYGALEDNQNQRAADWAREAIRIEVGNAYAWQYLGIAYHRLQQYALAAEAYRKASELDPGNKEIRETAEAFTRHLPQPK